MLSHVCDVAACYTSIGAGTSYCVVHNTHFYMRAQTRKTQNHEQGAALSDSSGPFFSQYLKMEKEDNKTAERWQKDSMSVLVFVRTSFCFLCRFIYQVNIAGRFVLCRHCAITCRDGPGSQGKRTG